MYYFKKYPSLVLFLFLYLFKSARKRLHLNFKTVYGNGLSSHSLLQLFKYIKLNMLNGE